MLQEPEPLVSGHGRLCKFSSLPEGRRCPARKLVKDHQEIIGDRKLIRVTRYVKQYKDLVRKTALVLRRQDPRFRRFRLSKKHDLTPQAMLAYHNKPIPVS